MIEIEQVSQIEKEAINQTQNLYEIKNKYSADKIMNIICSTKKNKYIFSLLFCRINEVNHMCEIIYVDLINIRCFNLKTIFEEFSSFN
jgi:hypothetical protein